MSKISSPLAVGGIIFIILGTIMLIAGIITLIANKSNPSVWYIWFLIITGLIMGIAGGVMLAIALASNPKPVTYTDYELKTQPNTGNTYQNTDTLYQTVIPQTVVPNISITNAATDGNSVVSSTLNPVSYQMNIPNLNYTST